jgi:hypothetical protein
LLYPAAQCGLRTEEMIKTARTKIATTNTGTTKTGRAKIAKNIPGSMTMTGKFRVIGTINTMTARQQGSGIATDYDPSMNPGFARDMFSIGTCAEWSTRFLPITIDACLLRHVATVTSSLADTRF